MYSRLSLLILLLLLPCVGLGQSYVFPINPGQDCLLTGNLGEIRGNHFHAGIDIAAQVNTPIYAAADGYVRRVVLSPYGYGKALYVAHPAYKQQSVYGHIERFAPRIEAKIQAYMYAQKVNQLDWEPNASLIPVKKGEIIAYSGNTGSSAGPHLHYEIRNMQDVAINPMLFKFSEIPQDTRPPELFKIALRPINIDSRVEGKFENLVLPLKKNGRGRYQLEQIPEAQGEIGLEIFTEDRRTVSPFRFGIGKMELSLDGEVLYKIQLDSIAHQYNRCMNVHINYAHQQRYKEAFQRCYFQDGNALKATFTRIKGKGYLRIRAAQKHQVRLKVWDQAGNLSILDFTIQGKAQATGLADNSLRLSQMQHQIEENILKIYLDYPKAIHKNHLTLSFNGMPVQVPLAYREGKRQVYLWDLRQGLPDYADLPEGRRYPFHFRQCILPGKAYTYQEAGLRIDFSEESLFDTLYLEVQQFEKSLLIAQADVPLFAPIAIHFSPKRYQDSLRAQMFYAGKYLQMGKWQEGGIKFNTKYLGAFFLAEDQQKPQLKLLKKSAKEVVYEITDDLSGIADYHARLNGKFILLDYEPKNRRLRTLIRRDEPLMRGSLVLEVIDGAGNQAILKTELP